MSDTQGKQLRREARDEFDKLTDPVKKKVGRDTAAKAGKLMELSSW